MEFQNYTKNLIKKIYNDFALAGQTCSSASIHDFRVGIKRLRSLFGLLSIIDDGLKVKQHEQKFRLIFKSAGKIRDLQVTEELIRKWSKESNGEVSEYYNFLKASEDAAKKRFVRLTRLRKISIFSGVTGFFNRTVSGVPVEYLERLIGRGVSASLMRVAVKKSIPSLPLEELHALRIEAKDARYRLQVFSAIQGEQGVLKAADAWLRSVHRAIGLWHDMTVAQTKLEKFLVNDAVKPLYSPQSYDNLKKYLGDRAKDSYRIFLSAWSDKGNALGSAIGQLQKYNV